MTSDRWRQAAALLDAALAQPIASRRAWVRAHAPSDEVCTEVWSLLDARERPSPVAEANLALEGQTLGPYLILRRAGQGGMGVVFEAEDTRLHRRVAVKVLAPRIAEDERGRQRLRQEARAAAALTHPGIATVFALEEIDGRLFIVSEFLEGRSLRDELDAGPLPVPAALATGMAIVRALVAAHDRGIVHRDIKPENVIRLASGEVKMVDFGLAQFEGHARDLLSMTRLTEPGTIAGTPAYMAPEQLLGRPTDARTDQFAFGVLLYELVEGRRPFGDGSLPTTIARVLAGEISPPPAGGAMPDSIWRIARRCLHTDPESRFATTRDLLSALEDASDTPSPAPPISHLPTSQVSTSHLPPPTSQVSTSHVPLAWWRVHQLVVFAAYWAMVWPAWYVHGWVGRPGRWFFFAVLGAVIVAANLRLHLWFSSRIYPAELPALRSRLRPWLLSLDVALSALLIVGGLAFADDHGAWAALLIGFGIGSAVGYLVIEPATTKAAFESPTVLH